MPIVNSENSLKDINLREEEESILRELKKELHGLAGNSLEGLFLYGSKARGDFSDQSDIDIMIIVRGLTRELKDKILTRIADLEFEYLTPLSAIVILKEDFDNLKKKERRLALDIEKEGIAL
ncbi:MAG: nucleotidyltransferase domain-containing protein [bacterium]